MKVKTPLFEDNRIFVLKAICVVNGIFLGYKTFLGNVLILCERIFFW